MRREICAQAAEQWPVARRNTALMSAVEQTENDTNCISNTIIMTDLGYTETAVI
jgi:hypothetical protein